MCYNLSASTTQILPSFKRIKLCKVNAIIQTPTFETTLITRLLRSRSYITPSKKLVAIELVCKRVFIMERGYNVSLFLAAILSIFLWFYWVLPIWKYCQFLQGPLVVDIQESDHDLNIKNKAFMDSTEGMSERTNDISRKEDDRTGSASEMTSNFSDESLWERIVPGTHFNDYPSAPELIELDKQRLPPWVGKRRILLCAEPIEKSENPKRDDLLGPYEI